VARSKGRGSLRFSDAAKWIILPLKEE
jgi:hypothetical protein